MRYRHSFQTLAPLAEVVDFHRRGESLAAITPPGMPMRFLGPLPERLSEGDTMTFQLWIGPVPVTWKARIESAVLSKEPGEQGFLDRQLEGPFRSWVHHHRFLPADRGGAQVLDEIEAQVRLHPLWGPVGLAMWIGLPLLFAYRGWKTRRLLEAEL